LVYLNEKNVLVPDNISLIRSVFLSNYNSKLKEHFDLKFKDTQLIRRYPVLVDEISDSESDEDIDQFNDTLSFLYREELNPLQLDLFDVIYFTPYQKLELIRTCHTTNICAINEAKLAYNKYEYYQFLATCSTITYNYFKFFNAFNSKFFDGINIELAPYAYEDLARELHDMTYRHLFNIFNTNFNLFNNHIASLLLANKVNTSKKKFKHNQA
jgi:hypothetical protein